MSTISASTTSTTAFKITTDTTGTLVFQTGASPTTAVTFDGSQNVGIGTSSPACKIDANGVIRAQGSTISSSGEGLELIYTSSTPWFVGNQGIVQAYNRGSSAYTPLSFSGSVLYLSTGGSGRATLDANGNLGLGVTPASGWQSGRKAMQIGQAMAFDCGTTSQAVVRANSYYNGTNDIYINSAASTAYEQTGGTHRWYAAGSGTAGNIISYSQYMMLDASGRLGINTTPTNRPLEIAGAGTLGTQIKITNSGSSAGVQMIGARTYEIQSSVDSEFIVYDRTAEAYRMRITNTGAPLFPNLPMFYAYTPGGPNTTSTGPVVFNTTRVNNGSYYNTSNGRFTVPVAGTYVFVVRLLLRTNGINSSGEITLYVNGGNVGARGKSYGAAQIANGHIPEESTIILTLAAGDYVQAAVYAIGSGMDFYYGDELGAFCGYLLG